MAEQLTQQNHNNNMQNEMKKNFKMPDFPGFSPMGITRERSFVRMSSTHHPQNANKRRSLAFNHPQHQQQPQHQQHQQIRGKPALEIYRPPSK